MRPRRRNTTVLLWLCSFLLPSLSSPLTHDTNRTDDRTIVDPSLPEHSRGAGIMVSWLWGLVWGDDSTVTVVDRTPVLKFNARPAAFGPASDVLGYMIRVEDYSMPCDDGGDQIDDRGDGPWWPGGGSEWGAESSLEGNGTEAERRIRQEVETEPEHEWPLEDRHGCPRLCVRGEHKPESSETWIALVMRGRCTFVDKVREAQRFGAKGVVVGGANEQQDSHGDGLVQMYSLEDASDVKIPSTYITHESLETLSSLIASSNTSTWGLRTVSVGITTDPSGWEWYSPLLTFLILLFLPSSLTICTLLVHRIRAARAARRERAPEDVVLNLPWSVWQGEETLWELEKTLDNNAKAMPENEDGKASSGEGAAIDARGVGLDSDGTGTLHEVPNSHCEPSTSGARNSKAGQTISDADATRKWYETQVECAICLEDFVKGDKVRVLPCRHIFHMEEIDDWLIRRKKLCPICKHDVTHPIFSDGSPEYDATADMALEPNSRPHAGQPPERTPLSIIYEEDTTEPTERTPLLRHGSGGGP